MTSKINEMTRTAQNVQQEFAGDLSGSNTIIWDLYSADQKDDLLKKLCTLIPDEMVNSQLLLEVLKLPNTAAKEKAIEKEYNRVMKENNKIEKLRSNLLNKLWIQRKYSCGDLLTSIIFILVTKETSEKSLMEYIKAKEFSCHSVFRIQKCRVEKESNNCCMIFVEENGRVYKNWDDFVKNNTLPKGIMITPRKGVYSFDENNQVELAVYHTPQNTVGAGAVNAIDVGAGVLGFGAALIPLATLLMPVAAPVLAVSAGVAIASGAWSVGRSTVQLVDRDNHEQSISVLDREARSAWIGVAGGAVGLSASGAVYGLARHAAAGSNIPNFAQLAVNGLNIAAIVTNGLGVGNGIVELILKSVVDAEDITVLDIAQLAASLALFTHSAYNFQYASNIIETSQNGKIQEFRDGLSRRQKRMFDKMYKETIRVKGTVQGKTDVVRSLGQIPDNKYFNDVYKINKELNKNKIKVSFGGDGNVVLNNEMSVDSANLRSNVQHGRGDLLNNVGPTPTRYSGASSEVNRTLPFNPNIAIKTLEMITKSFLSSRILSLTDLGNCICNFCETMGEMVIKKLYEIASTFFRDFADEIERKLGRYLAFEQVFWKVYKIAVDYGLEITEEFINSHSEGIIDKLREFYELQIRRYDMATKIKCDKCPGYYSIVELN